MSKLYSNLCKIKNNKDQHNKWMRVMEYNSVSGASVAVNSIKNGKSNGVPYLYKNEGLFAFTARTVGEKSRLYAFLITKKKPHADD